ncbi:polysaccharide biosynthesis protein, partial [Flavobacterium sp. IR1]
MATNIASHYISYVILILALDALVVIPFSWLRATERPLVYAAIKVGKVAGTLGLNIFFLVFLPSLAEGSSFFSSIYQPGFEIAYIFIANLIASALTLLAVSPFYLKLKYRFDPELWKNMISYG